MNTIKILAIGDIVGAPGRDICKELIPRFKNEKKIDFVIANGENMAGGSGITAKTAEEVFSAGVDVITSGDHIFKKKEIYSFLEKNSRLLRPANFPVSSPGFGSHIYTIKDDIKIGVINLLGRVFMEPIDCPFRKVNDCISEIRKETNILCIDIHAEATSEKIALGWYVDGKVSAVWGTHTHVQTADECILQKGTAYITDLGMVGPHESVLGRDIDAVTQKFVSRMPAHFKVANGDVRICGVIVEIDIESGRAVSIKRVVER